MKHISLRSLLRHTGTLLLLVAINVPANAQYYMTIHRTDGSRSRYMINNIDSIWFDDEPGFVDMGLSVNWATYNVGASTPQEYGDYFAWGETKPKTVYDWTTYKYCNESDYDVWFTKYCIDSYSGDVDSLTVLAPEDDVAHVLWGDGWRMPTNEEMDELRNNCTWTRTTQNNIDGYLITSNIAGYEGCSIFLPNAGFYDYNYSDEGYVKYGSSYWTSSLCSNSQAWAYNDYSSKINERYAGFPVRPVRKSETYSPNSVVSISLISSLSLRLGKKEEFSVSALNSLGKVVDADIHWSSSDNNVVTVSQNGQIEAISIGTCTITAVCGNIQSECFVSVWAPEYVDLGLSVNWATFNIGAMAPEQTGDYYAWGETYTKRSSLYYEDWYNYIFGNGEYYDLTKYCGDNKTILDPEDDVAHMAWGDNWRMPTKEELEELINNCTWTRKGSGYVISSNIPGHEDCSIFLPDASGYGNEGLASRYGSGYWSSSLYTEEQKCAWALYADRRSNSGPVLSYLERRVGFAIRAVSPSENYSSINAASIKMNCPMVYVQAGKTFDLVAVAKNSFGVTLDNLEWTSSDNNVATVSESGQINALNIGTCLISAAIGSSKATCKVNVIAAATPDADPEYVDLGLSVKWATFNVGAYNPEEYGDYFTWGETEPYYETYYAQSEIPVWKSGKTEGYHWLYYKHGPCDNSSYELIKYCYESYYGKDGFVDRKYNLEPEDDVAHMKWGGDWRMPSKREFEELCSSCTWTWTTLNGVNGYNVTSNIPGYEDRSIFLPAAGARMWTDLNGLGERCFYWSSELYDRFNPLNAFCLSTDMSNGDQVAYTSSDARANGLTVRPVCP